MNTDLQKLQDFLASEDGKKATKEFAEKLKREEDIEKRWIEAIHRRLLIDSAVLDKMHKFDAKHCDRLYDKYIDGQSNIVRFIFEAASKYGKETEITGDFDIASYIYFGYKWIMYCGQGCFISFEKLT